MELRLLDLFSGIGGFSYAAEQIVGQYRTVAFVEREPFCQHILRKHWPEVPIHDDITTFQPQMGSADVVCGGFPCQDISTAGKQAGIKQGTRSGLFYELMRVVRLVRPQYIILENVSAILANGLDTVLGELAKAGFDAEWACIPASAVGACHQRDRWWLVAYPKGEQRYDVRAIRPSQQAQPKPGNRDGSDPAGSAGPSLLLQMLECRRWPLNAANSNGTRSQGQAATRLQGSRLWGTSPRCLDPDWRSYLSEPVLCRGDDGFSGRVDRLKALGNAVVPQVAAIPLQRVKELVRGF
jgi:DNA (cytosine-5)-methyltransferase 1